MPALEIVHRTVYRYRRPVSLGPHRLMLRPRESREVRLRSFELVITPAASIAWAHDVWGNTIATATFSDMSEDLSVASTATVELSAEQWPVFDIAAEAISFPFRYSDDDWTDLGALAAPAYIDRSGRLASWVQGFVRSSPTDTLSLLKDISSGVAHAISYQSREDEGTQGPLDTLERGWGSCRDLAVLFVEAVRTLGFGARIVSGYLHNPDQLARGSAGGGSTHAWAEVYLPGAGWVAFDPTNRSLGGANLIPVAVVRDIRQSLPITGSFAGMSDAFRDLSVDVSVTLLA